MVAYRWIFQRRRLIIIAIVACACFLLYQILSLKELNNQTFAAQFNDTSIKRKYNIELINYPPIPGVLPIYYALYQIKDTFKCIESGQVIPYSYVNDDYCDCKDGSDEPSTSACPNNMFYCTKSLPNKLSVISSEKVNDGVCDCCDGSDEYLNIGPPIILTMSQINVMISSKMTARHPPCPDIC